MISHRSKNNRQLLHKLSYFIEWASCLIKTLCVWKDTAFNMVLKIPYKQFRINHMNASWHWTKTNVLFFDYKGILLRDRRTFILKSKAFRLNFSFCFSSTSLLCMTRGLRFFFFMKFLVLCIDLFTFHMIVSTKYLRAVFSICAYSIVRVVATLSLWFLCNILSPFKVFHLINKISNQQIRWKIWI